MSEPRLRQGTEAWLFRAGKFLAILQEESSPKNQKSKENIT
jgi:hypothetical protein